MRRLLALIFDWQIARQQGHLDRLVKERDQKIAQLKKATRYDTTQELLNKYGGSTPRSQYGEKQGMKRKVSTPKEAGGQVQRTGITPPPTANIPGRSPPAQHGGSRPSTPARQGVDVSTPPPSSRNARSPLSSSMLYNSPGSDLSPEEPGFAPNAFSDPPPQTSSAYAPDQQHRWYDRILDVMLGEDETLAKNRLALICANCRLVNGQAPPGVRTLEEIGRWRCGSCGAWNGVEKFEHQVGRIVQEIKMKEEKNGGDGEWTKVSRGDEEVPDSPELLDEKNIKEDEAETEDLKEIPVSANGSGSDSEESEKEADESVAERVAKTKCVNKRTRK